MKKTHSIHIVRFYGRVGGMEKYVWELTHALNKLDQAVTIICENQTEIPDKNIEVVSLGTLLQNPRYLYQMRFSNRVSKTIKTMNVSHTTIHSHERTAVHHVTTFHGPPFKSRKKRITDFLSPRIAAREFLEYRELCSPNVRAILPNSSLIADQLVKYYPGIEKLIEKPAYPGVSENLSNIKPSDNKKTIGFIGYEWKRKGLHFALDVVRQIQEKDPQVKFIVAGSKDNTIDNLLSTLPGESKNLGWTDIHDFFSQINLLIHPAISEPYGMVIAEANAAKIPVIVSSNCGIAPLIGNSMGAVLDLTDTTAWISAIESFIQNPINVKALNLTWDNLAKQHIALYNRLSNS